MILLLLEMNGFCFEVLPFFKKTGVTGPLRSRPPKVHKDRRKFDLNQHNLKQKPTGTLPPAGESRLLLNF